MKVHADLIADNVARIVNFPTIPILWTSPFNVGGVVTYIFIIWEKVNPFMCFQQKCPDSVSLAQP